MSVFLAVLFGVLAVLSAGAAFVYRKKADSYEDMIEYHHIMKSGPIGIQGVGIDAVDRELWDRAGIS